MTLELHNDGRIPEAILPTLFAPFRGTTQQAGPGLGLGLYITNEIVRAHGGSVEVSSSDAAGTTFKVTLPRHAPPPSRTPIRRASVGSQAEIGLLRN